MMSWSVSRVAAMRAAPNFVVRRICSTRSATSSLVGVGERCGTAEWSSSPAGPSACQLAYHFARQRREIPTSAATWGDRASGVDPLAQSQQALSLRVFRAQRSVQRSSRTAQLRSQKTMLFSYRKPGLPLDAFMPVGYLLRVRRPLLEDSPQLAGVSADRFIS